MVAYISYALIIMIICIASSRRIDQLKGQAESFFFFFFREAMQNLSMHLLLRFHLITTYQILRLLPVS